MKNYARAVLEANLKRQLKNDEIVHHVNRDHTDDRIGNLILMTRANHAKIHDCQKHLPNFRERPAGQNA